MNSNVVVDFLSGIAGATTSVYVGQPLDTIKTKLQTFPQRYKNFTDCGQKIFLNDGLRGFYAGSLPALLANAAENGILFMAYGQCQNFVCFLRNKSHCEQLTTGENMAAGSCASIFSSLALCPTELVKCQMQTLNEIKQLHPANLDQHLHNVKSPLDLTRNIVRTEGVRGLFRGFSTTLVRECPGYGCFFGGYELTRSLLTSENESKAEIGFMKTWIAGGMAGVCFWVITYPIDAVKTRTQVFKTEMSFLKYTSEIIKNEGVMALYAGLFPTLIRTFLATGTLFITYEQVRSLLQGVI